MKKTLTHLASALLLTAAGTLCAAPAKAQVKAALVQNVDEPARAPFQASVTLSWTGTNFASIAIPAGKRLVIDYVSFNGAAQTNGAYIQPYVVINSGLTAGGTSNYYYGISQSTVAPGQFTSSQQVTLYSDTLSVSLAFAGYNPTFFTMIANISGHLINP